MEHWREGRLLCLYRLSVYLSVFTCAFSTALINRAASTERLHLAVLVRR